MLKALVVIALVLAAILIYAATKPDTFRVERSATIKAPPEKVYGLISDFRSWSAWSPWGKKDPAMKLILSGAANGKGAVYAWQGNRDVGEGRMEIVDATPLSRLRINLEFINPFHAHNIVEVTLDTKGDSTEVTWAMHGPMRYTAQLMSIFFSMDSVIGRDFETGLANLEAD